MGYHDCDFARLLAAYQRKKHDRVPNLETSIDPIALGNIMGWQDASPSRSDGLPPHTQIDVAQRTHQDAIWCNVQAWLCSEGTVCSREDLANITASPFDPSYARRKAIDSVCAVSGTNLGVGAMLAGPFFTTNWCTGPIPIQSFMYMLYDDVDLPNDMMEAQTLRQIEIIKTMEGCGIGFVEIAEDLADNSGPMVSPAVLESLWLPKMKRIVDAVRQYLRVPIQFHCCGNIGYVIKYMLELGVDIVTPVQANCNDIYALKRDYGDRVAFSGNMAIDGILAYGTPDEVTADTRRHIEALSQDGGYVVASSHSICDVIPPENYFAMIDAAITYGKYS